MSDLQAPFPYFGGKMKIAEIVWSKFGNVKHYLEPFFGSGAVLLKRPNYDPKTMIETVCDKDGNICNVWRAIKYDPEKVAEFCDWPINHADLTARRNELIKNQENLLDNLIKNPEWYDAKLAAYWIYGVSAWIGSGFISKNENIDKIPSLTGNCGINKLSSIPSLTGNCGINKLSSIPHLTGNQGINKLLSIPHIGHIGKGINSLHINENIYEIMKELSFRFRYVRVVCGDWKRICGGNWQDRMGICGMFFDPPYSSSSRVNNIYTEDSMHVANEVREYCIEKGKNKTFRICLAGYEDEHMELSEKYNWQLIRWKANGGFSNQNKNGNENSKKECLWFSPFCLKNNVIIAENNLESLIN